MNNTQTATDCFEKSFILVTDVDETKELVSNKY
jgi:hypothetical protein